MDFQNLVNIFFPSKIVFSSQFSHERTIENIEME